MDTASEKGDEKHTAVFIAVKDIDTAAVLVSGEQGSALDPEEVLRIRFVVPEPHFEL